MGNLSNSFKKFLGNKNFVTILGFGLCVVVLWIGYSLRINQKVALTEVPYASTTIQPRTEITADMIAKMSVPESFLVGSYYRSAEDIVGKYSNYNTIFVKDCKVMRDLSINIINYLFGNKPLLAVFCLYVYIIELLQHHYDPKALEQPSNLHHFQLNELQNYV